MINKHKYIITTIIDNNDVSDNYTYNSEIVPKDMYWNFIGYCIITIICIHVHIVIIIIGTAARLVKRWRAVYNCLLPSLINNNTPASLYMHLS